jgi:hypothetical protein
VLSISAEGHCVLLDLQSIKDKPIYNDTMRKWLQHISKKENYMKLVTFGVLCHSKYLDRFRGLTMHEIMQAIMWNNNPSTFFEFVVDEWNVHVPEGYEEEFYEAAHIHLYGTCYSLKKKRLKNLSEESFQQTLK